MKQGKKPTVAQMNWLKMHGLDPKQWLIVKWTPVEAVILNRGTRNTRTYNLSESD